MEFVAFIVLFLICMGIAKAINSMRRTLAVNGAAIYLVLAALFIAANVVIATRSGLAPYQLGYAFGHNVGPAVLVGLAAIYYFFQFRADQAHERHVRRVREQRDRDVG